ncbi:MAG: D-alanyl-D-alanine carboxypeptidase family protein [Actinomycetota bacterium]
MPNRVGGRLTAAVGVAAVLLAALVVPVRPAAAGRADDAADRRVPSAAPALPEGLPVAASIVVDADTGEIILGDAFHEARPPASTSKLMTALVATERLAPGRNVTVSARAAAVEPNKIGFSEGSRWPLPQMLAALLMVSANDAAYAIGEAAGGGSLEGFARTASETAARLGMTDSTFADPSGLDTPGSFRGGPRMSAYDLAIAARNVLTVPALARWVGMHSYEFTDPDGDPHSFTNTNKLLPGGAAEYPGAIGLKTGFTNRAQHTLVAAATRDGRTLIVVLLGAITSGWQEATALLDAGFATRPVAGAPKLPEPTVSPYAVRLAQRSGFAALGGATAGPTTTVTSPVPTSFELSSPPSEVRVTRVRAGDGNGPPVLQILLIVVLLLLAAAFVLRRRAVKRQRAARLAARRRRDAAMRSGGLPVVDGRYRPGSRNGPPLDSTVRVRRLGLDDTDDR